MRRCGEGERTGTPGCFFTDQVSPVQQEGSAADVTGERESHFICTS